MVVSQMNLQARLYATQRIRKPPFKKTGEIAASDNKQMPATKGRRLYQHCVYALNVRLYPILKLLYGVLVKVILRGVELRPLMVLRRAGFSVCSRVGQLILSFLRATAEIACI